MNNEVGTFDRRYAPDESGSAIFHPGSLAEKLCRLYGVVGADNSTVCRSPCRYHAFPVTETEFILILDDLRRTRTESEIRDIIRRSTFYRRRLEAELTNLAEQINGRLCLREVLQLGRSVLPFDCVLCAKGECAACRMRPLACAGLETPDDFMFLKHGERTIFRRPLPLFWWFSIIFRDEETLKTIADTPFFRGITKLSEQEYIQQLIDYPSK